MPRPRIRPVLSRLAAVLLFATLATSAWAQEADDADQPDVPDAPASVVMALPAQPLTPQIVYQLLLSEIAGARGQMDLASQGYLDLARKTRDPRVAKRATEVALFARRAPEAVEASRLWAELDPGSTEALQTLAGLLAGGMGGLSELEAPLARLLAKSDKPQQSLLGLNRTLARYPDKAEVRKTIDRLSEPYLQYPEAHYARAYAAYAAGDSVAAQAEADKALAGRKDWEVAALLKVQLLQQKGQTAEALSFLKGFLAASPNARDARYAYARLLAVDRQYPASRAEFERLVKELPDNGEVGYTYALLLEQMDEYAAAETQFKRLLPLDSPGADAINMQLGQLYEEQKRWPDASAVYRAVTGPQKPLAQSRAALIQARGGDLSGARANLQRLREAEPKQASTYLLAEGQLLRELGKNEEAFALLGSSLASQPDQVDVLYDYSLLAEKLGKIDVMEKSLRRLIELRPDEAQAYNALGYSLADRNQRLDEAQGLIKKALTLSPDDGFILDSMGWVLFRRGDLNGALDHLQRAYAARPDPEIAAHLGEVQWKLGRKDEAHKTWSDAAKAHPDNTTLAEVMKRFEQ
ncbi:tetratricopeptide repeat protein [Niveibacterium sp. SC-1]|uniref:tetratricopeptide repeat protein n=1 Tax=Niveibacterium sp. SC-1 TaxID=3135646 RepID=UPI00311ED5B6